MKLPKFRNPFRRKRLSREQKELKTAKKLLGKLAHLRTVRFIVIFVVFIVATPYILFWFFRPRVQEGINYGTTFSDKYATQLGLDWKQVFTASLDDLGIRHYRLVAYWDEIEAERDVYNFDNIIWQLEEAQKRDAFVIMTIGRKVPRYPECFEPQWWKDMEDQKERNRELLEYIEVATTTLKDYDVIKIWQVENEPFFEFGECDPSPTQDVVAREIAVATSIDDRPIIVQDSGEGGFWFPAYQVGDFLGISMYRRVWFDFWKLLLGNAIYFHYPLSHWTYKIKAHLTLVPQDKIIVTELQAEPWGPVINHHLTKAEKDKTMSRHHFIDTIAYAQKTGFKNYYLWGVEWWFWEKFENDNPFYWDTAKALYSEEAFDL